MAGSALITRMLAVAMAVGTSQPLAARPVVTIKVATHYNARQSAPLLACFRQYEGSHPGVRIVHQQISYRDFLQTALISRVGRSPVDIYNLYSIWAPQLIGTRALAPPPPDIQRFVRSNYKPSTVAAATIRGRLWGIPSAVSVYQLAYNRKLLAAAGFRAPPRTWAELERIAGAITRKNRGGNIVIGGFAFGQSVANVTHVFYAQMYAAGVPPFTADMRGTNLRSPVAVRILTQQAGLFRKGITSNSIDTRAFTGGAVGMTVIANWQKDMLSSAFGPRFRDTVGIAPIPTEGPGGTMIYTFFWGVDAASPAKRQAWNLLRWLNSAQTPRGLSCTGETLAGMGDLTGNTSDLAAMAGRIADPFSRQFLVALSAPGAASQANVWHAEEVDRVLKYYIELAWAGRMTPAAALAEADSEIRAILMEQP